MSHLVQGKLKIARKKLKLKTGEKNWKKVFLFFQVDESGKIAKLVVKYHTRIQIDGEPGGMGGDEWRRHEYGGRRKVWVTETDHSFSWKPTEETKPKTVSRIFFFLFSSRVREGTKDRNKAFLKAQVREGIGTMYLFLIVPHLVST
jgi:hypothetical protein